MRSEERPRVTTEAPSVFDVHVASLVELQLAAAMGHRVKWHLGEGPRRSFPLSPRISESGALTSIYSPFIAPLDAPEKVTFTSCMPRSVRSSPSPSRCLRSQMGGGCEESNRAHRTLSSLHAPSRRLSPVERQTRTRREAIPLAPALSLAALLATCMDDYFALQPQGIHEDGLPSSTVQEEGYTSPLDSPDGADGATITAASAEKEGARQKAILSPSELVSVLGQDLSPPPKPDARECRFQPQRWAQLIRSVRYRILAWWSTTVGTRCTFFCPPRSRRVDRSVKQTHRDSEMARIY